jgi:hypothetical protein
MRLKVDSLLTFDLFVPSLSWQTDRWLGVDMFETSKPISCFSFRTGSSFDINSSPLGSPVFGAHKQSGPLRAFK